MGEGEQERVSRDAAEALASNYRTGFGNAKQSSAIKKIPFSLLCAEHIQIVVEETGLVAPFYIGGGRKSRLKTSAYEGRIGEKAYLYNNHGELTQIFNRSSDSFLRVPKNQIVFVECDLDFRLPIFIAARFNLQITHVHRGLLLGTGPLIDPGYWGKLCIPLHNLTDHDYNIPKDEGLIWIEFTKTTTPPDRTDDPIGRPPLDEGEFFSDITVFLKKASKQYGVTPTPIRSALPSMFEAVADSAKSAEVAAEKSRKTVLGLGIAGSALAIIAVAAAYMQAVGIAQDAGGAIRDAEEIVDAASKLNQTHENAVKQVATLSARVAELERREKQRCELQSSKSAPC